VVGWDVRKIRDGGIGEYVRETIAAIATVAPEIRLVAFGDPRDRGLLPPAVEWVEVSAAGYSLRELWAVSSVVNRAGVDLFHAPHYVLPFGVRPPAIVTIHDLIHVLFPRTPLHALYGRWMIGSAARRAARLVTVSERSAADLRRLVPGAAGKIHVVANGVAPRFHPLAETEIAPRLAALGVERPYVLLVANRLPHKNVESAIRAFAGLPAPRPRLVLCGRGYEPASPVWRVVAEAGVSGEVRAIGSVEPEALVALYAGAAALLSTSLYEGFGLPIVEAMASGTPVVASDAGAVPEVAGDAALLVPPERVDTIRDRLYRVLHESALRERLIARGLERARAFSWTAAARTTIDVYREILEPGRGRQAPRC
jgi:glycosyltransferase involved in cell wall biosynthesis